MGTLAVIAALIAIFAIGLLLGSFGASQRLRELETKLKSKTRYTAGGQHELAYYAGMLNDLAAELHRRNVVAGWLTDPETGEDLRGGKRNYGMLIALMHSELSESLEGYRKNKDDDHLPHRKMVEVEIADAIIRELEVSADMKFDIGGALVEKLLYNEQRADHKLANRRSPGGKKF